MLLIILALQISIKSNNDSTSSTQIRRSQSDEWTIINATSSELQSSIVPPMHSSISNGSIGPPTSERTALLNLYEFNNGANWICAAHWTYTDIENTPCKLYGLGCTFIRTQRHITYLELPACGLEGSLPESFRNLKNLSYLDLSHNFQHSPTAQPVPDQLKDLQYLKVKGRFNINGQTSTNKIRK